MCVYIYCMNGLALESVCIMHRWPVIQGTFDAICHLVTISEGDNRVSDPRLGNPTLRNSLCLRVFIATTLCGAFWILAGFVPTLDISTGVFFSQKKNGPILGDMSKLNNLCFYLFLLCCMCFSMKYQALILLWILLQAPFSSSNRRSQICWTCPNWEIYVLYSF